MNKLEEVEIIKYYNFQGVLYGVNQFGVVYGKNDKPLKTRVNSDGYIVCWLEGQKRDDGKRIRYYEKVHKMVATMFVEKPDSEIPLEVNHKDCDRTNNYYTNLEWITHYDNIQYSIKMGRHKNVPCIGEDNVKAKLTKEDVLFIREKYDNGMRIRDIYRQYYLHKVTETSIENVCKKRTWKHI